MEGFWYLVFLRPVAPPLIVAPLDNFEVIGRKEIWFLWFWGFWFLYFFNFLINSSKNERLYLLRDFIIYLIFFENIFGFDFSFFILKYLEKILLSFLKEICLILLNKIKKKKLRIFFDKNPLKRQGFRQFEMSLLFFTFLYFLFYYNSKNLSSGKNGWNIFFFIVKRKLLKDNFWRISKKAHCSSDLILRIKKIFSVKKKDNWKFSKS